jgi:enterochelin esterase-like enzyme
MPWGHAVPFTGSQSNNTATFERYLLDEVWPRVEKKYRVARDREHRAIVGLSMGGGQALQIGLGHLDQFSAVAAFSSAVPPNFATRFQALLDHPEATNKKLKLLWIGCGRQDPAFERNQTLSELLTAHHVRNTFYPTDGLHNYTVWRRYLVEVAPLLFRASR